MVFGVYPGGKAGTETGLAAGPDDDAEATGTALTALQGDAPLFIVRSYVHYEGSGLLTPAHSVLNDVRQYCHATRKLDLVLCFHADAYVPGEWQRVIEQMFDSYGDVLHSLQLTEEPNLYHFPGDGRFADIAQVVIDGVCVAKREAVRRGLSVQIGFNAVPCFNSTDPFWTALKSLINPTFLCALDYVGLDFFPDVFRPVSPDGQPGDLTQATIGVLEHFRLVNLLEAGIGMDVPICITENGWPTSTTRHPDQQATVLAAIIRLTNARRHRLNITRYTLFSLRDANSCIDDIMHQFGVLNSDYTPKPAFTMYQKLIAELSV